MDKPLFLLSLDALGYSDEDIYSSLPFFKNMIEKGTWIRRLQSIYPTLTYPIHSTIISGRYPISHGVDNNLKLQPEKLKMDWNWDEKDFKGDSIFKAARRKNIKVSAFSWPVTGYADIEYNFPEVWSYEEDFQKNLKQKGSEKLIEEIQSEFGDYRFDRSQDYKDEYLTNAAAYVFEKYRPDFTFMHLIDVDHTKHHFGAKHKSVKESIERLDKRLFKFFEKINQTFDLKNANIMLLSDHSQLDTGYGIRLNKLLADMGLLEAKEDGTVKEWLAYFLTCGGSSSLYMKSYDENTVKNIVKEIEKLNIEGIDRIFDEEEIKKSGASDKAVLWVEAKEGYAFEQSAIGEIYSRENFLHGIGNHGFLPNKEKNFAMGIFCGPDFKENNIIEFEEIINVAPTIDKIYNLNVEEMISEPINKALK